MKYALCGLSGLSILSMLAPPAVAAPAKRSATITAAPLPSQSVDELTVTPTANCLAPRREPAVPAPKVLSTFPADGAVVRPGVLVLRVTFDLPMSCSGFFAWTGRASDPCPKTHQAWVLSYDRRTIRTVCHLEANSRYGVAMSDRPGAVFISLAGKPLDPFEFAFSTSSQAAHLTPGDSLAEDDEQQARSRDTPMKLQGFRAQP